MSTFLAITGVEPDCFVKAAPAKNRTPFDAIYKVDKTVTADEVTTLRQVLKRRAGEGVTKLNEEPLTMTNAVDKWNKWNKSIIDEIKKVDFAFIDATFYDEKEINNRDITEIPHPFVIETMELFNGFSLQEKEKIYFIHMNHTNPLLDSSSLESEFVLSKGFNIARALQSFSL